MAGITTAAILGATAISAGAGIGSAAIASRAAGKAADTQSDAADKALALQERIYQQQRADTLPMLNRANQAGNTLSGLMGLPTGPLPGPTGVPDTIGPPPGAIPDQYGPGFGLLKPGVTPAQARDPNFQYNPAMAQSQPMMGQPRSAPPQNASSYAMMRAPTGEVQPVPQDQVAHYEQMGARRIG